MYQFLLNIVTLCVFSYALLHIGALIKDKAEKSMAGNPKAVSRVESVRQEYGVFGQKYANKDVRSSEPPSAAQQSLMDLPKKYRDTDEAQSQLTGFAANPQSPGSPFGPHGNNYSLYDINNPSGMSPKF